MYIAGNKRWISAFTLIELLVVIGLIGALAAGIGVSMRGGNPTSALRGGQSSLVGLLSSARGQAAINQSDAMIIIDVTNAQNEDFLRALQVVVKTQSSPEMWKPVGDPVILPQGVYVVPPSSPSVSNIEMTSWPASRRSTGFQASVGTLTERTDTPYFDSGAFTGRTFLKFQVFTPLGTTTGQGTILVTSGRRKDASTIVIDNPEFIRGVYVSNYGVPTLINEAATFDNVP